MKSRLSSDDINLWRRLVDSHKAFALALQEFLTRDVDRVTLMRNALHNEDRTTALYLLPHLKTSELEELWSDLIFLASFSHGAIQTVRDVILSLSREWVLARIEETAEPLLRNGTYDEYRRFLELYIALDHDLAVRLARRAVKHPSIDVKEAGEDALKKLSLSHTSSSVE